ncbi:TapB family protein [Flavobacterium sp. RSSB_23]|uniref:TapB family protein n=1 Tax=Flavobacterium sp. RSSB_23 TaxID=3447668 RepID=UPI003F40FF88
MKATVKNTCILFLCVLLSFSFYSLNCEGYYATKKGTVMEMKVLDNKNNVTGKSLLEVIENRHEGGKSIAVVKTQVTDLKKNKTTESSYELVCDGAETAINMLKSVEASLKKSTQFSQSSVSGNNPVFPNTMKVGQTLPEATISISVKGEISLDSGVKIYDRKVVAEEKITLEAGTFDCIVITYTEDTSILFNKTKKYKVWMARGVGIVKSEEYDKKERLEKVVELTKFSK